MVRWRGDTKPDPDPRLLVVTITETDLREQEKWPFPDQIYADLLEKLQSLQANVIGLDVYRDFYVPPGSNKLKEQLQQPNIIAIRNIDILSGTPAPPDISPEQVGFNDFPLDPDGVVRRILLYAEGEDNFISSFALNVAVAYLQDYNIEPQASEENPDYLQLGKTTFIPLEPNNGGYHNIDSNGYQILFNYRNRNNVAQEVTISQVLKGEIELEQVKDKIVLIGTTATSLKDQFPTPYSRDNNNQAQNSSSNQKIRKMSGVIIHAQIVSQLLDAATGERSLFGFWSQRKESLWIFSWICLGSAVGWIFRHPISITLAVGVSLIMILATAIVLFYGTVWIPVAAPIFGFLSTVGIVVTYQSYQNHQQQQIVMKLLGQNTSPEIAAALWQGRDRLLNSGKLPGVMLRATIMFLDIKGFSTISEGMHPQELLNWLNQLLKVVTQEVLHFQGIINKFTGDGVMAVFGVPVPSITQEEIAKDAQQCVSCALAISDRLKEVNANWQQYNLPKIQMRIGIFTGSECFLVYGF